MTPTFRYPTYELLLVTGSSSNIPVIRAAVPSSGLAIALTTLTRPECLSPHLSAEDSTCPDLILLDLSYPEALAAVREIKEQPVLHEIPLVALVRDLTGEQSRALYNARANCCVETPQAKTELAELIQAIVHYWFETVCLPSPARRQGPSTLDW